MYPHAQLEEYCSPLDFFQDVQWNHVIFSDECSRLDMIHNRLRLVRRRNTKRLQYNMVCHTMKYGGYAIMLWGAMKGVGKVPNKAEL